MQDTRIARDLSKGKAIPRLALSALIGFALVGLAAAEQPDRRRSDLELPRIKQRERQAAVMLEICALDASLMLTSAQRQKLYETLSLSTASEPDARWPAVMLLPGITQLPNGVSAGAVPRVPVSKPQVAAAVWPAQAAAFDDFQVRNLQRTEIYSNGIRQWLINNQPPLAEQRRRLAALLDRYVENTAAACTVDDMLRSKLRLAGRLDIETYAERYRAVEAHSDSQVERWFRLMILGGGAFAIYSQHDSTYQKFLRSRLDNDQKKKLAVAESERLDFHKQSLVAAVLVGFQRSAALTADECDALENQFNHSLVNCRATIGQRSTLLQAITEIPEQEVKSVMNDEQWLAAKRHLTQLRDVAAFLQRQELAER